VLEIENCNKNKYRAKMASARRQIIGGGGAPINKIRRRRRLQIVGGAARRDQCTALVTTPSTAFVQNLTFL